MDKQLYIVDDNPDHHFLFHRILREYSPNHKVMFFGESKTLLPHLLTLHRTGQELPALIVLDLNMPGKNGLQLLRQLKEPSEGHPATISHIPVVIMSSETDQQKVQMCYELGANAFIEKSLDFHGMRDAVKALCDFWLDVNHLPHQPG